jgi:hypothetical protein
MGERKRTIKLVSKLLNNEKKRSMYSDEELQYMELQVKRMKMQRAINREQRKRNKGFS